MKKTHLLKRLGATALSTAMLLSTSVVGFASGGATSTTTIPVVANIDSYYEIVVPTGIGAIGADDKLHLTREYNNFISDAGLPADVATPTAEQIQTAKQNSFYGYVSLKAGGTVATGKKVVASLTCADLVNSTDATSTADVYMSELNDTSDTDNRATAKAVAIWEGRGSTANSLTFASANWVDGASTGVTREFTHDDMKTTDLTSNQDADYIHRSAMLRTTLPKDGEFTSNLVIDFSLVTG